MTRHHYNMIRALLIFGWLLCAQRSQAAGDASEVYLQHRAQLPEEEYNRTYYLSLLPAEGDQQRDLHRAICLMVASSSRQQVIEHCTPERLGESPYLAINTDHLQWDHDSWLEVLKDYPYQEAENPLVIRADWLLKTLADGHESNAYRLLLYGTAGGTDSKDKKPTRSLLTQRDQILKLLGVSDDRELTWGYIESDSGVAVNGTRLIRSLPIARSSAWGTRDVLKLEKESDPLENLAGDFEFDAEEWIVPLPKVSIGTGERGHLQAYFLADAKGEIVDRAPVDIVTDSTEFRGFREIRNPGSCIQCHPAGLNLPTRNDVHDFTRQGASVYTDAENRIELHRFYGSDLIEEMRLYNESYAKAVFLICKLGPEDKIADVANAFKRAINRYDQPLDLIASATELGLSPEQLQFQLGQSGVDSSARLVGLAHGRTISRDAFEQQYLSALALATDTEDLKGQ